MVRRLRFPLLFLIVLLALGIAIGSLSLQLGRSDDDGSVSISGEITTSAEVPQEFGQIFEVWANLKKDHFDRESLDPGKLTEGAIRGMLEALDDPYASYLNSEQYSLESEDLQGQFEGIGAEVTMRDGRILIVAPISDTPAEKAGIRPGDVIIEIDGESTEGFSLFQAVNKIRGPKGEAVELVVVQKTGGEPVPITIIRDVIEVKSVNVRMLVGGIAHLKITSFTESTDPELVEALKKVAEFEAEGLIVDVRNNPGGLLDTIVKVTSRFIDGGLVLYEVDGRGSRRDWRAKSAGMSTEIPMVLLMNEFSASGSEVLAGALIDHQRATVVGVKSFGKGSVNTLRSLSDGSGLYFTIARWYTPNGTLIEGQGLEPHIEVIQPEDDTEDVQLDKAIEVLEAQVKAIKERDGQKGDSG